MTTVTETLFPIVKTNFCITGEFVSEPWLLSVAGVNLEEVLRKEMQSHKFGRISITIETIVDDVEDEE